MGCRPEELRALIAREYLIPIELVEVAKGTAKFTWSTDQGLLDMDTDAEGGLSALENAENTDD